MYFLRGWFLTFKSDIFCVESVTLREGDYNFSERHICDRFQVWFGAGPYCSSGDDSQLKFRPFCVIIICTEPIAFPRTVSDSQVRTNSPIHVSEPFLSPPFSITNLPIFSYGVSSCANPMNRRMV